METILLHRLGHLTVDAAQWILAFLDMQLHESLIHQITIVLSPCMRLLDTRIQILYQIRNGTALHRFSYPSKIIPLPVVGLKIEK